jgi:D-glycero-D-manno-heptose 1,7-bisphosphate phosphatase
MSVGGVFFDRDGVLIVTDVIDGVPTARNDLSSVSFLPGAIELCRRLWDHKVPMFMVTNQPDIARGKVSAEDVHGINAVVSEACRLTATAVCPHDDDDRCACRKPRPGMIVSLASNHDIDLASSVMIGDRWRDMEAGQAAGCATILIDRQYGEAHSVKPTHVVISMEEVGLLLEQYFNLESGGST